MTMTPFLPPSPISAPNHLLLPLWESPPRPTKPLRDRALQTCCPFLSPIPSTLHPQPASIARCSLPLCPGELHPTPSQRAALWHGHSECPQFPHSHLSTNSGEVDRTVPWVILWRVRWDGRKKSGRWTQDTWFLVPLLPQSIHSLASRAFQGYRNSSVWNPLALKGTQESLNSFSMPDQGFLDIIPCGDGNKKQLSFYTWHSIISFNPHDKPVRLVLFCLIHKENEAWCD